jgi:hypothetical protein
LFSGESRHTGQGRKRSCPYTVYAQILLPLCQTCHCTMCCCQMLFRPFVFTKVNIHVICISCRVA